MFTNKSVETNWNCSDNRNIWVVRPYDAYGFSSMYFTYYSFTEAYAAFSAMQFLNANVVVKNLDVTLPEIGFNSGISSLYLDFGAIPDSTYELMFDLNEKLYHTDMRIM